MKRGRRLPSLRLAAAVAVVLGLIVTGWLAWRRPEHAAAWLSLMPLCGP